MEEEGVLELVVGGLIISNILDTMVGKYEVENLNLLESVDVNRQFFSYRRCRPDVRYIYKLADKLNENNWEQDCKHEGMCVFIER